MRGLWRRAAPRAGVSPHSFIVEAIAARADQDEQRRDFEEAAELLAR